MDELAIKAEIEACLWVLNSNIDKITKEEALEIITLVRELKERIGVSTESEDKFIENYENL